jgi:hypothetical protein
MASMDLIMFRGDDIVSEVIATIQNHDQFTHAGLVINSNLLPQYNLNPNRLYILESTFSHEIPGMNNGPSDAITGEKYFGVQLRDLEEVCKAYIRNDKTKIGWYPLKNRPLIKDFSLIFLKYHKKPFLYEDVLSMIDFTQITFDVMEMAKTIITPELLEMVLGSSFSCVNLVTSVYQDLGLISTNESIIYPIQLLNLTSNVVNSNYIIE